MITRERLLQLVKYDSETGYFYSTKTGFRVGSYKATYTQIKLDKKRRTGHRMAWLYVYGNLPTEGLEIDHIDGNKHNNAISNLRCVTRSVNRQNLKAAKSNSRSNCLGVSYRSGAHVARIRVDGIQIYLGRFKTQQDASDAYIYAKRLMHEGCTI